MNEIDLQGMSPENFAAFQSKVDNEYIRRYLESRSRLEFLDRFNKLAKLQDFGTNMNHVLKELKVTKSQTIECQHDNFFDANSFRFIWKPNTSSIISGLDLSPFWHDASVRTIIRVRIKHNLNPNVDTLYDSIRRYPIGGFPSQYPIKDQDNFIQFANKVGKAIVNQPAAIQLGLINELIDFMTSEAPKSDPEV